MSQGLRVLVDEQPDAPVTAVYLWFDVGAADERHREYGAAHFVEHMLFKGTRRRGVGEPAGEIEALGGDVNAYTTHDETVFHATVLPESWEQALDVLADMTQHSLFDLRELELEREVILTEIQDGAEDPDFVLGHAVAGRAWKEHPYGRSVIGPKASVVQLPRSALLGFWRRWYRPSNLVVSVSGPVRRKDVEKVVTRQFGGPASLIRRAARPREPLQRRARWTCHQGFLEPQVELSFCGVSNVHRDAAALDVLACGLGQGDSSVLGTRLRLAEGLVTEAWAAACSWRDGGQFSLGMVPRMGKTQEAMRALWESLEQVSREGLAPSVVARARTCILADRRFGRETVDGRAHEAAWYRARTGHQDGATAYDAAVSAVTPQQVREVAGRFLIPSACTTGVLLPPGESSPAQVKSTVGFPTPRRKKRRAGPRILRRVTSSGLTLLAEPGGSAGVAALRVVGMGGLLGERKSTGGQSVAWGRAVACGTRSQSHRELAARVEAFGGVLFGTARRNTVQLGAEYPSEHTDEAVDLLVSILLSPRFEASDVSRVLTDMQEQERNLPDRPGVLAWREARRLLFGTHPYGLPALGTETSRSRIDPGVLRRLHARRIQSSNLVISVSGDMIAERLFDRLESKLEGLATGPSTLPVRPQISWPKRVRRARLEAGREQAQVVLAWPGCAVTDPDRAALTIAEQILSGQGGRLFSSLREKSGLVYGVGAELSCGWDGGLFALSMSTEPQRVEAALSGAYAELESLAAGPDPGEIKAALQTLQAMGAISVQRARNRAVDLAMAERFGLDAQTHRERAFKALESVEPGDVARVLTRRLEGGHVEVCVSPRSGQSLRD